MAKKNTSSPTAPVPPLDFKLPSKWDKVPSWARSRYRVIYTDQFGKVIYVSREYLTEASAAGAARKWLKRNKHVVDMTLFEYQENT